MIGLIIGLLILSTAANAKLSSGNLLSFVQDVVRTKPAKMKKRFIVLIDFSTHSRHLLSFVYAWAKKAKAEIILIHQVVKPTPAMGDMDVINTLKQNHKAAALEDLKSFANEVIGIDPSIHFLADTSHLISIIDNLETADTIDCIFAGIKDKPAVDKLFLGNTVSVLSKQLDKIIIAFPATHTDINLNKLYVGIKKNYPINEKAFQHLIDIMKTSTRELLFFSSIKPAENQEDTEKYLQQLHTLYGNQIKTSYKIYKDENPMHTVKDNMIKNKGFLVIQKGSRTLTDLFRKFWTTEMIHTARIPIIILPNNN